MQQHGIRIDALAPEAQEYGRIAAPCDTATSTHVVNEKTSTTMVTSAGARAITAVGPRSHRHVQVF